MKESETIEFDEYKTQLQAFKSAWGNEETYTRQCIRLLEVFSSKHGTVQWNSKALNSP